MSYFSILTEWFLKGTLLLGGIIIWYYHKFPFCLIGWFDLFLFRVRFLYLTQYILFLVITGHMSGVLAFYYARDMASSHRTWLQPGRGRIKSVNLARYLWCYREEHSHLCHLVMCGDKTVSFLLCTTLLVGLLLNIYLAVYIYFTPLPLLETLITLTIFPSQVVLAAYIMLPMVGVPERLHLGKWMLRAQYQLTPTLLTSKLKLMTYFELVHREDNQIGFTIGPITLIAKRAAFDVRFANHK